jgi:hypothetical protein
VRVLRFPSRSRSRRHGQVREHQDMEQLGAGRRLRGELDDQNQVRDHAADESDRPDKLL